MKFFDWIRAAVCWVIGHRVIERTDGQKWLTHLSNCPDSHCEPDPRNSTEPAPVVPAEVEERVIEKIRLRRDAGRKKYGKTMERSDLTRLDWLRHAQEEAMDLAIYLEKLAAEAKLGVPPLDFSSKPDFVKWVPLEDAEALAKALEHALPFIRSTIGLGAYGSLVEANEVHSALAAFRAKHPAPVQKHPPGDMMDWADERRRQERERKAASVPVPKDHQRVCELIGSIYFYGKFKAETANERELEALLRKLGYFFETEADLMAKLHAAPVAKNSSCDAH